MPHPYTKAVQNAYTFRKENEIFETMIQMGGGGHSFIFIIIISLIMYGMTDHEVKNVLKKSI